MSTAVLEPIASPEAVETPAPTFKTVCAWCVPQRVLSVVALPAGEPSQISHGICPACAAAFFGETILNLTSQ